MKAIDQQYLRRANWFGMKRAVAKLLGFPPVNAVVRSAGRHLLPTRVAHRLPLARQRVSYSTLSGEPVYLLDAHADLVARDLYWGGSLPTSSAETRKLRCIELLCRDAGTFLDVGAYSGICALIAARANPAIRAIAYEIVPENYFLLTRNVVENDLLENVEPKLLGLGAEPSTIMIPVHLNLPSRETSVSLSSRFDGGVRVPVSTLDAETPRLKPPFVMKIDVEGFEVQVLRGGEAFIREHRPDIICEVLPDSGTSRQIQDLLDPLGYSYFVFAERGLERRESVEAEPVMRDWLFSARPTAGEIASRL